MPDALRVALALLLVIVVGGGIGITVVWAFDRADRKREDAYRASFYELHWRSGLTDEDREWLNTHGWAWCSSKVPGGGKHDREPSLGELLDYTPGGAS